MAQRKVRATKLRENTLPGMEAESLPPGLEKTINKYHDREAEKRAADVTHKKSVETAFAAVKTAMHENNVKECKLRINGEWVLFRLLNRERGKFIKIKRPGANETASMKIAKP